MIKDVCFNDCESPSVGAIRQSAGEPSIKSLNPEVFGSFQLYSYSYLDPLTNPSPSFRRLRIIVQIASVRTRDIEKFLRTSGTGELHYCQETNIHAKRKLNPAGAITRTILLNGRTDESKFRSAFPA
jgi:hypothetical protein